MASFNLIALQQKEMQHLKQMQRLMMLPQMQQALHLLQLPVMELAAVVQAHLELNPLLLSDEEANQEDEEVARLVDEGIEESIPEENDNRPLLFDEDDFARLQQLDQELYGQEEREHPYDRSYQEQSWRAVPTLFEQLMEQVGQLTQDPRQLAMAELLIGNLSAAGYLTIPLEELAMTQQIPLDELRATLHLIQTLEPAGIGATTVQEALLLQLKALGKQRSLAFRIVSHCYGELLHNKLPQIEKTLHCTQREIQGALQEISRLNLHPGNCYDKEETQLLIPDVLLHLEGEHFEVEVNEDPLPSLCINHRYLRLLGDPAVTADVKEFVRQKLLATRWLLRTISQRHTTLYRLTHALAKKQHAFFMQPSASLLPLTMQTLAEEMGINPSTVVRAVANKYIACPRGLLPLRSLFTHACQKADGETVSAQAIRDALRLLIEKEDKRHPLSDEALAARLQAQGLPCARRTVAKYRVDLKAGNVRQRRKY